VLLNLLARAKERNWIRHRLVKNTAALFAVQVSGYAAPLLVLPYLSRVLSTDHFGLIAYATSFNFYFISLVEYGFNLTATRRIAICAGDSAKTSQIFSSVMAAKALLTCLGFLMMMGAVLATPKLRPHFPLFCISYLAVLGDLLFPLWLFQGLQKMENLVWRDLSAKLLSMCLIFAFVRHDGDYLWAAGFQAGSAMLAGVVGLITVPILTKVRFVTPTLAEIFTALREGWPVFLSMAAMTLSSSTNVVILGLRSGPKEVAYYSAAYRLLVAMRMLVQPLVTALYPHISHLAVTSRAGALAFLRKYAMILSAPFLGASLFLLLGAWPIIHILYGQRYAPATRLLCIMAPGVFLLALQHVYSTFYMLAFGFEKEWSRLIMLAAVVNFAVLIPLMYLIWPPEATAIAGLTVDVFLAVATYLFYRKSVAIVPDAVTA
jgi:polysaccharide transporter, PST family